MMKFDMRKLKEAANTERKPWHELRKVTESNNRLFRRGPCIVFQNLES